MILPELELPVNLIGAGDDAEQYGKTVTGYFNPTEIAAYHDGYYPNTGIFIYLKGGQPIQIGLTMEQCRDRLREYWIAVNNQNSAKQNMQSVKQKLGIRN